MIVQSIDIARTGFGEIRRVYCTVRVLECAQLHLPQFSILSNTIAASGYELLSNVGDGRDQAAAA
jgi:hypothetical protein